MGDTSQLHELILRISLHAIKWIYKLKTFNTIAACHIGTTAVCSNPHPALAVLIKAVDIVMTQ